MVEVSFHNPQKARVVTLSTNTIVINFEDKDSNEVSLFLSTEVEAEAIVVAATEALAKIQKINHEGETE